MRTHLEHDKKACLLCGSTSPVPLYELYRFHVLVVKFPRLSRAEHRRLDMHMLGCLVNIDLSLPRPECKCWSVCPRAVQARTRDRNKRPGLESRIQDRTLSLGGVLQISNPLHMIFQANSCLRAFPASASDAGVPEILLVSKFNGISMCGGSEGGILPRTGG